MQSGGKRILLSVLTENPIDYEMRADGIKVNGVENENTRDKEPKIGMMK